MKELPNEIVVSKHNDPEIYNLLLILKNTKFGSVSFNETTVKEIKMSRGIPYYVTIEKKILLAGDDIEIK